MPASLHRIWDLSENLFIERLWERVVSCLAFSNFYTFICFLAEYLPFLTTTSSFALSMKRTAPWIYFGSHNIDPLLIWIDCVRHYLKAKACAVLHIHAWGGAWGISTLSYSSNLGKEGVMVQELQEEAVEFLEAVLPFIILFSKCCAQMWKVLQLSKARNYIVLYPCFHCLDEELIQVLDLGEKAFRSGQLWYECWYPPPTMWFNGLVHLACYWIALGWLFLCGPVWLLLSTKIDKQINKCRMLTLTLCRMLALPFLCA